MGDGIRTLPEDGMISITEGHHMITIHDEGFQLIDRDSDYDYQEQLTSKLDDYVGSFDQDLINEVVLWKLNRYAHIDDITLARINRIDSNCRDLDKAFTVKLLGRLLQTKGIQLPMASTILRFKNPYIYQIIDQRVYRVIYGKDLKVAYYTSKQSIDQQIETYLQYLEDLGREAEKLEIPFEKADRILYMADRRLNKDEKLSNYG